MDFHFMKLQFSTCSSTTLILLILYSFLSIPSHGEEAAMDKPDQSSSNIRLFVFGDSVVDTGNNNYLKTLVKSNYPPYGRNFKGGIPTGRFSDGKVFSDLTAEELGIADLSPPYLDPHQQMKYFHSGANFASSGSGYDPKTPKILLVLPLSLQLGLFKDYIVKLKGMVGEENNAENIINNSIYLVSAGNNDIAITYFLLSRFQFDLPSYLAFVVSQASAFIKELYELGARRIFILSTEVLGCTPAARTIAGGTRRECNQMLNEAAEMFISNLSSQIDYLNSNLPQADITFVDIYHPLLHLIQHPQSYGFSVVDRGCCGTGTIETGPACNKFTPGTCMDNSRYVFWDSGHLTERAVRIILSNISHIITSKLF